MRGIYHGKDIIVKQLLTIKSQISGNIYRDRRPTGSDKEDIVVNALPMTNEFHQKGVFNVNVYVPFLSEKINGIVQFMPNHKRLKELYQVVNNCLLLVYGNDYNFYIENHQDFEEQSEKASYINFRVRINLFNKETIWDK